MRGLKGKNALVTGGSSGIGQAVAVRLAEHGANVAINYLDDPANAEGTAAEVETCVEKMRQHGVRQALVQGDVSREEDATRLVRETVDELGGMDVLVNNAGIQLARASHELSAEDFDAVLAVNLRGAFLCARAAVRHFLEADRPGSIVNVSSVHQRIPKPEYLGYAVSKGGVANLTSTLALEYADRGIRVNALGPGATVTPINRGWVDDPQRRAEWKPTSPWGGRAPPTRWRGPSAFSPATTPPTSLARRCTSTAG